MSLPARPRWRGFRAYTVKRFLLDFRPFSGMGLRMKQKKTSIQAPVTNNESPRKQCAT